MQELHSDADAAAGLGAAAGAAAAAATVVASAAAAAAAVAVDASSVVEWAVDGATVQSFADVGPHATAVRAKTPSSPTQTGFDAAPAQERLMRVAPVATTGSVADAHETQRLKAELDGVEIGGPFAARAAVQIPGWAAGGLVFLAERFRLPQPCGLLVCVTGQIVAA